MLKKEKMIRNTAMHKSKWAMFIFTVFYSNRG